MTFDPSLSCPIVRNITCAQDDCGFWDASRSECIFYSGLSAQQSYNEKVGSVGTVATLIDLGRTYKNVTVFVDGAANLMFHSAVDPTIALSATYGRVGVPIMFKGINARYVYLAAAAGTVNYAVEGDA